MGPVIDIQYEAVIVYVYVYDILNTYRNGAVTVSIAKVFVRFLAHDQTRKVSLPG